MARITISIDENSWKEFMKQSIDMNTSASARIQDYILKELAQPYKIKKRDINEIY